MQSSSGESVFEGGFCLFILKVHMVALLGQAFRRAAMESNVERKARAMKNTNT